MQSSLAKVRGAAAALVFGVLFMLVLPVHGQPQSFWHAIEANDVSALRAELRRGINPNSRHPQHGPAIVAAARAKAFDVLRVLSSLDAVDVDATNAADETALMVVSIHGDRRSIETLIQRGAQVNRPGWTPLHYAASGGHVEIVQLLLEQHAFIDAQSANLTTPLMLAARMRALPVVQLLIDQGADPSLRNQGGLDAATYLERNSETAWANWMRERVRRYVARYGTVEQPRWTASADGGAATEADTSASQEMDAVPLSREVSVGDGPAVRPTASVPGVSAAGTRAGVAAPSVPAPATGTLTTSPARPPAAAASSSAASKASIPAPAGPSPSKSVAGSQPPAQTQPVLRNVPSTTGPSAAVKPPVVASKPPAAVSPSAVETVRPSDEPLFFSRTLSLPSDPSPAPSGGTR